jgi:predicted MFS family arabinose efflux permease
VNRTDPHTRRATKPDPHREYESADASPAYARYVLGALFFVGVFALVDRQIFGMLIEPLKQEFDVSDTELGLASGLSFALFYGAAGLPIARLADRGNRRSILAAGLGAWSALTLFSGFATSFAQLVAARLAIGVGEAAGTPTAHALIADYFPPERRARALSVYSAGASVGVILAYLVGGWVQELWGWRGVFLALGAPGVLLALLVRSTVREPRRGRFETKPPLPLSTREALRRLLAQPAYRFVLASFALHSLAHSAAAMWHPAYLSRVHGMAPREIGTLLALGSASFSALGVIVGGVVTDRLAVADRRWLLRLPGLASIVYAPLSLLFLFAPVPELALLGLASSAFLSGLAIPGMHTATQELAEPASRATASALNLLILTLVGSGLGPTFVGIATDLLAGLLGDGAVRWSLALAALVNAGSGTQALFGARWLESGTARHGAAQDPA